MTKTERSDELRKKGLTPTIQRMAVLECLEKTKKHPTADQVLATVRETFPSVSRGTVYNTLEALTQAGLILRITVDPAVARYDADLGPHAHFRCRICSTVYDIVMDKHVDLAKYIGGHHVEAVRAYGYGVCEECLSSDAYVESTSRKRRSQTASSSYSPLNPAQRKAQDSSNEPTNTNTEKTSKMASRRNSPTKRGGEFPNA